MEWLWVSVAATLGYGAGSVPVAYLVSRWTHGVDIRAVGSGNVGAANVIAQVGLVPGLGVLAIDAAKGAFAMLVPLWLGAPTLVVYVAVTAVVVGHNWPFSLGFRGGKGVAPVFGASFAALPLLTVATALAIATVLWYTRKIVLGAAAGFALLNLLTVVTSQPLGLVVLCLLLTLLALVAYVERTAPRLLAAIRERRWVDVFPIE